MQCACTIVRIVCHQQHVNFFAFAALKNSSARPSVLIFFRCCRKKFHTAHNKFSIRTFRFFMPRLWRTEKTQMEKRNDAIDLRRRQDQIPASIAEKKGRILFAALFLAAENPFFRPANKLFDKNRTKNARRRP